MLFGGRTILSKKRNYGNTKADCVGALQNAMLSAFGPHRGSGTSETFPGEVPPAPSENGFIFSNPGSPLQPMVWSDLLANTTRQMRPKTTQKNAPKRSTSGVTSNFLLNYICSTLIKHYR